ncbi:MAG TPA: anthranilate synthase component I [Rhizomicrobium sp.]|jgi:anthranilate synthase component 1
MKIEPDYPVFSRIHDEGRGQAVFARRIADLETPVSAYMKLAGLRDNAFLLESVHGGESRGRYSIIGVEPDVIWQCRNGRAGIVRTGAGYGGTSGRPTDTPFQSLRMLLDEMRMELPDVLPPMCVGLFGYLGYDMVREIERLGPARADPLDLPDAILFRPTITAIFDNLRGEIILVTPAWPAAGTDAGTSYSQASQRLSRAAALLDAPLALAAAPVDANPQPIQSNMSRAEYLAIVERAKAYIRAGDIFQVVPSQRFRRPFALQPFSLYRSLRRLNPSPFLYHLAFPGFAIVGSSPEILVRLRDGIVTVRPIAGTRRRGANAEEDTRLGEELVADPKERAEHLMLLDLGRNDVGRVAETGSVQVTGSFFIERYSHVMHLVSNVEGRIRDGLDAVDALAAGLPAGTLTGAPKIRAMEIIDEFEQVKRGAAYAGAVGYIAANGSMDTCIVLRTAVVKDGVMYVQAGGGVVADSVPEAEFEESVNKARALFSAADEAHLFVSSE